MRQPSYLTFADTYKQHDIYSTFPQKHWQAGAIPVDFIQARQGDFETIYPATHTFAIAICLGYPQFCFSRSFKATTGQSAYQYVLERRIARACELLAISSLPLAEVAAACGFYDQAHLIRIFKKQLGTTPGAYRREVQS